MNTNRSGEMKKKKPIKQIKEKASAKQNDDSAHKKQGEDYQEKIEKLKGSIQEQIKKLKRSILIEKVLFVCVVFLLLAMILYQHKDTRFIFDWLLYVWRFLSNHAIDLFNYTISTIKNL